MPALLAIADAEKYVGGAYLVFLVLILVYVAIMAGKLQRIQRELSSLAQLAEENGGKTDVGQVQEREHRIETVRQEARR